MRLCVLFLYVCTCCLCLCCCCCCLSVVLVCDIGASCVLPVVFDCVNGVCVCVRLLSEVAGRCCSHLCV